MSSMFTTAQAAERLGITAQTLISYAQEGKLPASFIARKWRFKADDIESFIISQRRSR
jgi:excisionase family DNA binding protein